MCLPRVRTRSTCSVLGQLYDARATILLLLLLLLASLNIHNHAMIRVICYYGCCDAHGRGEGRRKGKYWLGLTPGHLVEVVVEYHHLLGAKAAGARSQPCCSIRSASYLPAVHLYHQQREHPSTRTTSQQRQRQKHPFATRTQQQQQQQRQRQARTQPHGREKNKAQSNSRAAQASEIGNERQAVNESRDEREKR